jgi:cation diffusion facilitator family transporter
MAELIGAHAGPRLTAPVRIAACDTVPVPELAAALRHDHAFLGHAHARNERRMRWVLAISVFAMVVEAGFGLSLHSMALLGEGLHLASHAAVFLAAMLAYAYARRHVGDPRFSFGLGKVGDLTAFGSAVLLAGVALTLAGESLQRLVQPVTVSSGEALPVAAFGLMVSLASAWLLHEHEAGPASGRDLNLRAAYVHLVGDVLVGLLALAGLAGVSLLGWTWLDPAAGLAGAAVVARFAWTLARQAGAHLLDMDADPALLVALRDRLEQDGDQLTDLHVWRLGPGHQGAILSIASPNPRTTAEYRQMVGEVFAFSHLTVEVQRLPG